MMKKIVYYVATSLDGFIAGVNDDISKFMASGEGVNNYLAELQNFQTVIMGRRTYEFGYQYGMIPGQPAYPHMQHYIFSNSLRFDTIADNVNIVELSIAQVEKIKQEALTDIYLCGGGQLAGWLLDYGLIDILKIKLNPIILGDGIPLFGSSKSSLTGSMIGRESFEDGLEFLTYDLLY